MRILLQFLLSSCALLQAAPEVRHVVMPKGPEMQRAELYVWQPPRQKARGVMVFCPGHNGSGEGFVRDEGWQRFATDNKLALCGLSFASEMEVTKDGRGYSRAERGSGELLLEGLEKELHDPRLPLFLYGYSAGARFTTSFLAWKPDRVAMWCASGVGTWPPLPAEPARTPVPQGIVACGENDAACYWSSLHYFQSGRERDYPWTWISLEGLGHGYSDKLDRFVIHYFSVLMGAREKGTGRACFDISTKRPMDRDPGKEFRIFAAPLPADEKLIRHWTSIHHP